MTISINNHGQTIHKPNVYYRSVQDILDSKVAGSYETLSYDSRASKNREAKLLEELEARQKKQRELVNPFNGLPYDSKPEEVSISEEDK